MGDQRVKIKKYFKRKAYDEMLQWKQKAAPDYVLFLKGARRTGKSTLAEKFGAENYKSYILIRFDKASPQIKSLFTDSLDDLDTFFNVLQLAYKKRLYPRESLIILDEIQLFPLARQALKTLLEDGRYDYIETGSLATVQKGNAEILVPSEEYPINVNPMDFEEYLWANDDEITMGILREHFQSKKEFGTQMLHSIMKKYREYMCVGGMPQAVSAYIESHDFGKVDFVKQSILNLYNSDMESQQEENSDHAVSFFNRIPSELSKHDKRYVVSHIDKNARVREFGGAIKWLQDARIINIAEKITELSVAFNLNAEDSSFKCYLCDTGLLISLAYKDRPYLENELYGNILADKLQVNEGMLIENMVAQSLTANGHQCFFYKKEDKENKKVYEVDFAIREKSRIRLIEVKSGRSDSIKSLKKAKGIYGKSISEMIVLHAGEMKRGTEETGDKDIIYMPYFMAGLL